ncbi:MAG: 6,7-dimethyl-8-ribityllumazine synthase [Porticoccus sp.]|jgi:6,7-dimethyl-8-ribityllumazine synthase
MSEYRPDESSFNVGDARIAIVVARWNGDITENLLEGARRALARHGIAEDNVDLFRVPGAFELPLVCQKAAKKGVYDAIVALGCVIRGGTPHFDYVCSETTRGIGEVALNENVPVAFGLLTTDNLEQAEDRSGDGSKNKNHENKGEEAALTALEMISLFHKL